MILATPENLKDILARLREKTAFSLDTETTGLRFDRGDRLFSIIISDGEEEFYFNFQDYPDTPSLSPQVLKELGEFISSTRSTVYMHNAKFDLWALHVEGIAPPENVHCTQAIARLQYNGHLQYGLDACAERIGLKKSDAVEEYIKKHRLWEWEKIPGKKTRVKRKFFGRVPFELISSYAATDARVTFHLGISQEAFFSKLAEDPNILDPKPILENEKKFTLTCFEMEKVGVLIDRGYCERTIEFETGRHDSFARQFKDLTGMEFVDSYKSIERAFSQFGIKAPQTDKGNPSYTDGFISKLNHPAARCIQEIRGASKKVNSYYRNFLYWSDDRGVLHPNIRQGGTATGRISVVDPALQTIPKKEESADESVQVRKAFIVRPDFLFVEMDYKAMEFRMLVDYARERGLAQKIKTGLDPHEATAKLVGVDRKTAKTISFGLLYGMGVQKLADDLGVSFSEAQRLKAKYFEALPNVRQFIYNVTKTAKQRGYIRNWFGRRSYFPDANFAYKAVNYLIQGGGADIVKVAMNEIRKFLAQGNFKTKMVLQVHDAILFEVHKTEMHLIPGLKSIMEKAYPHKLLPMEVSLEYSYTTWGDLVGGAPSGEAGDKAQGEGTQGSWDTPKYLGHENTAGVHSGDSRHPSVYSGEVCGVGA